MLLTNEDQGRLKTALGESLGSKVIAVLEDAASRGNVSVPSLPVRSADPADVSPEPVSEVSDDSASSADVDDDSEGEDE